MYRALGWESGAWILVSVLVPIGHQISLSLSFLICEIEMRIKEVYFVNFKTPVYLRGYKKKKKEVTVSNIITFVN